VAAVERARESAERDRTGPIDEAAAVASAFRTNKVRAAALLKMARAVLAGEG
jgi:hypothetical protein